MRYILSLYKSNFKKMYSFFQSKEPTDKENLMLNISNGLYRIMSGLFPRGMLPVPDQPMDF